MANKKKIEEEEKTIDSALARIKEETIATKEAEMLNELVSKLNPS